jgi:ABC-type sugar transport system substrate-binding protein
MHHRFTICLLTLLFLFVFAGCRAHAGDAKKYIFILKFIGNPYWQALKQGIEDAAKDQKITVTVMSPNSDQAKEEHVNQCEAAISQKPAIIVMGASTAAIGLKCYKEAQKQGIKVADIDATVSVEEAKESGVRLSFTIGADNQMIGRKAAQFVAGLKRSAPEKILILEGLVGSPPSTDRVAGFKQELGKVLPQAKIVASVPGEWDRLKALNITSDTLAKVPDLTTVFAANDVMALGAVEAIKAAGKTNRVSVIGVDGIPDARKAILAGKMTASLTQLPYWIGKRSVELAVQSVRGAGSSGQTERAPILVMTKSVLELKTDPLMQYVR